MRVLGIDPGLRVTGYGIVEQAADGVVLIEAGELKTKQSLPLERRLLELHDGLEEVVSEFNPGAVAIEELYAHYKHPKTAVIMGHARGVFFLVASRHGIPVYSYGATRIKKSLTGSGHATKEQIAGMLGRILDLGAVAGHADVSDAIAAALCHINVLTHGGIE